uniref:Pectinesterase n=1 Tax=Davidia involucrata TaxID=16924 RepID=A0A5B7B2T8_DAVIN
MGKKAAIIGVSSIFLVAMVVAAVVTVTRKNAEATPGSAGGGNGQITTTTKAIKAICQPTDYKETCENSLSTAGNTTDPKELIKVAFQVAVKDIGDALKNSTVLQQAAKDKTIRDAFDNCRELLDYSIADLQRSFEKLGKFEVSKLDSYVADLKTWLSGAVTYQQTCLDGFENTTGDSGEKMKKLLKTAGELTSNGLAMVTQFSTIFENLGIQGLSGLGGRRLLSDDVSSHGFPYWVSDGSRRLLQAAPASIKPNVVVAKDGSGKYKTINEAIKDIPLKTNTTFVIYIKAGVYEENVELTSHMRYVMLLGDGPTKTKITGSRSKVGGYATFKTGTVSANGDGFMAKNIGFENTAGSDMHQAVALRVSSDRAVIYNCQIDGYQDTLYAHVHRQFYRDCIISGTIDFIFGDALSLFQNCKMVVRMPLENQNCMVTAHGRKEHFEVTAIVIQNCTITAEPAVLAANPPVRVFLGRPWKNFSRTIVMNSQIDAIVDPEGWSPWAGTVHLDTLYYAEYNNRGPGAVLTKRVTWPGIKKITPEQAANYAPGKFLQGDDWIPQTGVPYIPGMIN